MLKIGDKAPDFTLKNENDRAISLKDFTGKKIVLYFYPKDDTPGCTAEACSFRDSIKTFEKKNSVIIGISKDSIKSHKNFSVKYKLPFTLLSDDTLEVLKKYEVWKEKSMYGRKYLGIERTTFIIDEKGRIKKIFNKVKVNRHIEEIIDFL